MQPEQPQQPSDYPESPQPDITPQTQPQMQPQTQQPQPMAEFQPQVQPEVEPQTQYTPQPVQPVQQPTAPATDPGKLFSILGLVFSFIALQLPGLILSIIGLRKSKKAGFPTTLAIVGICLNIFFMIATIGVITAITLVAYNGVQERTVEATRQTNAGSVLNKAEVYNMTYKSYPTIEQLRSTTDSGALTDEESAALKDTDQPTGDEIGYRTCEDDMGTVTGANIYIYSNSDKQVVNIGLAGDCGQTTVE